MILQPLEEDPVSILLHAIATIHLHNVNRKAKDNKATQVYWHFSLELFKVFINAICVR